MRTAREHRGYPELAHYPSGLVPGDGVHLVWPMWLGLNRARHIWLTGQILSASEARHLGLVSEVLPQAEWLKRTWELARIVRARPALTTRLTREARLMQVKRAMLEAPPYGLALEGLAACEFWPTRFAAENFGLALNRHPVRAAARPAWRRASCATAPPRPFRPGQKRSASLRG